MLLLGYGAIVIGYFAFWWVAGRAGYAVANILLPVGFLLVSIWGVAKLLQGKPLMVWSPLPWFLAACGVYFGLGPLAYFFGSPDTVQALNSWYAPSEWEIWRINVLNGLGMALVVGGFALALRRKDWNGVGGAIRFEARKMERLVVVFLIVGVLMSVVAQVLAWLRSFGVYPPSSFEQVVTYLLYSTLVILVLLVMQGRKRWWPVLFVLGSYLGLKAVLSFSKLEIILVFLFLLLGVLSRKPRKTYLAAGFLGASALYMFSIGLVPYGRTFVAEDESAVIGLEAVRTYAAHPQEDMLSRESLWWTRLSYTSAQAFAMNAYDRGDAGGTVGLAPYALVPRFFWPSKPRMTAGAEFNYLMTGSASSQSAPGFFAETYWNGGWLLFSAACLYVGFVFGMLTLKGSELLSRGELAWLPCACVGVFIGLRPDDWFASTYVGGVVFLVWLYVGLFYVLRLGSPRERPPARWGAQRGQAPQGLRGASRVRPQIGRQDRKGAAGWPGQGETPVAPNIPAE